MSESAIRTAIYNAVNGVSNVGKVYDYERYSNEWDTFLGFFKTTIGGTTQVRGWMVGYRGIREASKQQFLPGSKTGITRIHRFQVLGVMGIDDSEATEKTFAALAEDVCDALDGDGTLHSSTYLGVPPVTMGYDPAPFAGILVHAAAINVEVAEAIRPSCQSSPVATNALKCWPRTWHLWWGRPTRTMNSFS